MGLPLTKKLKRNGIIIISLLGALLLVMTFMKMSRLTPNPRSRVITVERLVDSWTWSHMNPTDTTTFSLSNDMVKVGDRYYSSKPPLYPLLMAGEALLISKLTGTEFHDFKVDYLRILVILNQVLPYLLMLWCIWLFLLKYVRSEWTAYYMLFALSIGMLSFGYSVTINNHTPSAILYVFIFLLWEKISQQDKDEWWRFILLGGACGFAFAIELPSGGIAAWFLILSLSKNWKKGILAVLPALVPVLISMVIYKNLSGVWKPFYLQSELYRFEGSYWNNPADLDAIHPDKWIYFFHMFLGFRGLFSMTPILLLGLVSYFRHILGMGKFFRKEFTGIMAGIFFLVLFIIFRSWNYGGNCIGMRWFICFMPLMMLMATPLVDKLSEKAVGRVGMVFLLLWSIPWNLEALYEEAYITGLFERMWDSMF